MFLGKVTWDGFLSLFVILIKISGHALQMTSWDEYTENLVSFLPFNTSTANHSHVRWILSRNAEGKGTDWCIRRCGTAISFTYVLAQVKKPTINGKKKGFLMLHAGGHIPWIVNLQILLSMPRVICQQCTLSRGFIKCFKCQPWLTYEWYAWVQNLDKNRPACHSFQPSFWIGTVKMGMLLYSNE